MFPSLPRMSNYRINIATAIHKGDREYQQDRVQVIQHPYNKQCLLVLLADGMGGRSGGALASAQVIDSGRQLLQQFDVDHDNPQALLRQLVMDAHSVIRMLNISSEHEPHTTVAAFLLMPSGECFWIHSGDSRLYHFRRGAMICRTRDHSYVQSLLDEGKITEAEAYHHPKSNLLVSCLGGPEQPRFGEQNRGQLEPEDVILACSDGLWGHVSDKEMAKITFSLSPTQACQQLTELARSRGHGVVDNLSMVILKTSPPDNKPAAHLPETTDRMLNFEW